MPLLIKNWILIIIAILLVVLLWVVLTYSTNDTGYKGKGLWRGYRTEIIELEGVSRRLVVAENPAQWTQGLMYVRKPVEGFDGMIFKFTNKQPRLFWNKNTYENLVVYWLADGKVLGKSDLPSIEQSSGIATVESPAPADTVIEIIK